MDSILHWSLVVIASLSVLALLGLASVLWLGIVARVVTNGVLQELEEGFSNGDEEEDESISEE